MAAKRVSRSVPIAAVAKRALAGQGRARPPRTLQLAKAGLGLPATAGTTL